VTVAALPCRGRGGIAWPKNAARSPTNFSSNFELLKSIQSQLVRLSEDMREVKERLGTLEMQYANLSNRVDRIDRRLERVEGRLDLIPG
jgi:predicted  nucleic acid-binding Zn-ribbon protein